MYIPGRLRTASKPFKTLIECAPYSKGSSSIVTGLATFFATRHPKISCYIAYTTYYRVESLFEDDCDNRLNIK